MVVTLRTQPIGKEVAETDFVGNKSDDIARLDPAETLTDGLDLLLAHGRSHAGMNAREDFNAFKADADKPLSDLDSYWR
jgi:hypothetical protein